MLTFEEIAEITRKLELDAPTAYLSCLYNCPEWLNGKVNGVGSPTSFLYHITPDTIWGLDITPASHIHDYMYMYPEKFFSRIEGEEYRKIADDYFFRNSMRLVLNAGGVLMLPRVIRATWYYWVLRLFGGKSFWDKRELY